MAKSEWMYCGSEWDDLVDIIKLEKNPAERLREFHDIIKREGLTLEDVYFTWLMLNKEEMEGCAEEWFYDDDLKSAAALGYNDVIYWFFNIFTGEAMRIRYSVQITCSGIAAV